MQHHDTPGRPAAAAAGALRAEPAVAERPRPLAPPRLRSPDLFGNAVEIEIEHDAQVYRLRKTSLGKLILTK
ncbi:MAG: hemin uptake protein HemP [Rubrivivax sp.]|nr:hemin uptake protein HemP [Rubrivivax sp.]